MRCTAIRRRASAFIDSELDGETTFEISEHLRFCDACRERFEAEQRAESAIADRLRGGTMPAEIRVAIRAEVESAARQGRPISSRRPLGLRIGWWGLVAAAACVAGLAVFLPSGPRPTARELIQAFRARTSAGTSSEWVASEFGRDAELAITEGVRLVAHEAPPGHDIQFVSLEGDGGSDQPYIDVRLLCCGEPVLLRIARVDALESLGDLANLVEDGQSISRRLEGLHVSARQLGDYVAVAIAEHPIDHIVRSAVKA